MDIAAESANDTTGELIGFEMIQGNELAAGDSSSEIVAHDDSHGQVKNNRVTADLYKAAAKGDFSLFANVERLDLLLTATQNTILHIHFGVRTKTGDSVEFVKLVLQKCQDLIWKVNRKDETLLHIAARYGHDDLVGILLEESEKEQEKDQEKGHKAAKEMVGLINKAKDTPLHEAARYNHQNVVTMLIDESPSLPYSTNEAGETPLYLAVERGFHDVVSKILEKICKTTAPEDKNILDAARGPNGRTILHAAVLRNDKVMTKLVLEKFKAAKEHMILLKEADLQGWIPLHYAASSKVDDIEVGIELLNADSEESLAYIRTKGKRTSLHIAAACGMFEMMKELISRYPDCCELVDENDYNVLHFAVQSKKEKAVELIVRDRENAALSDVINGKNGEGLTPLDLVSTHPCMKPFNDNDKVDKLVLERRKQVIDRKPLFKKQKNEIEHTDPAALAGQERKEDHARRPKESEHSSGSDGRNKFIQEMRDAHIVVAALVATVTFTAGFTLPGGYISEKGPDQGYATLSGSVAFRAFTITNMIAFVISSCAVIAHLHLTLTGVRPTAFFTIIYYESHLIIVATLSMVVAFITGTYSTLVNASGLAIATCVIACLLFAINGTMICHS